MIIEEFLSNRLHALGIGIYDPDGIDGNIFLLEIPELHKKYETVISIIQTSSFSRELKINTAAIHPVFNIYVKGKRLIDVTKKANEIAEKLSEDSYMTDKFIIYQTYIFSEPIFATKDEKSNYIYTMQISQTIGELKS